MSHGCLTGSLTHEILARHSCLHPVLTLCIPTCASHMSHFVGCLIARYLRKLLSLQLLESSHFLSITQPLQSNPTINIGYKRLNRITIKFGTELKPTKHIVVNYNFTISPFGYSVTNPLKTDSRLKHEFGNSGKTHSHLIWKL